MNASDTSKIAPVIDAGVPADALAFYGRWWQLERWLREMVHFELSAKYGSRWFEKISSKTSTRASRDKTNSYMASADSEDLLSYADASVLFDLIDGDWGIFSSYLLPQRRWHGAVDELIALRHRNAHCRRPHPDDLAKIQQMLRDLEDGAWKFYSSYLDDHRLMADDDDPMVGLWVTGQHATAQRLLRHAETNYDTRFQLWYTTRPWVPATQGSAVSGPGVLWKAKWFLRGGQIEPRELARRVREVPDLDRLLVHVELDDDSVIACLPAAEATNDVADAIGRLFDLILETTDFHGPLTYDLAERSDWWQTETQNLPARFQANSAFSLAYPGDQDRFTLFGV